MIGASIALSISDIPWNGPIAGVFVGMVDGEFVINPTSAQREKSVLELTVAGSAEKVVMIEAGAKEIPDDVMYDAIIRAHEEIRAQGYAGAILYPQEEGLRAMYRKMGYHHETHIRELRCSAGGDPVALDKITAATYFAERAALLPPDAIRQGSPFPELTENFGFYRGEGALLAATVREKELIAAEYLGPEEAIPGILRALDCERGIFRCGGEDMPFAMICPLTDVPQLPRYFAFPLD
jgi:hypothetical protein